MSGIKLEWVRELRYLGVFFVSSAKFKCSYTSTKKAFYRSFNAIYGHVGTTASEDVILSLVKSKYLPVLLYGLDVCPLTVTDSRSFDFTVTRILMKIFKTNSIDVIDECRQYFAFHTVEHLIKVRKSRFLTKYANKKNYFVIFFHLSGYFNVTNGKKCRSI